MKVHRHLSFLRRDLERALDAILESENNLQRHEWDLLQVNLGGVFRLAKRVSRREQAALAAARAAEKASQ